ncbi:hypothetical protein Golob_022654, partial [Gossypium lobatum]|nr:hypothetical protein [Gossypium lobatum]
MFRLSPGRNQRSKGLKVKHALQICVLVGICIWLLYQVKHSGEKKAIYEKSGSDVVKLGRKDFPRSEGMTVTDARHKEEEEEESKNGEEDNKPEVTEDEGNGEVGGMHEHDNEKPEEGTEHEERRNDDNEETMENENKGNEETREGNNEEKENIEDSREKENKEIGEESNETEKSEGEIENAGSSDDRVLDGIDGNNEEAREEHYKGDDASSEVVHDTQNETSGSENSNEAEQLENKDKNDREDETNSSEAAN